MICEKPTNHDILRQPSSIIVLSFDFRVVFYNEYLREAKRSAIFTQGRSKEGEVRLRMSRILFAAKQSFMTLRVSRPLFVGSYLEVTRWPVGQ